MADRHVAAVFCVDGNVASNGMNNEQALRAGAANMAGLRGF
jgi:hypothetical protein